MRPLVTLALVGACGFRAPDLADPAPDASSDGAPVVGDPDAEGLAPDDGAISAMTPRSFITQLLTSECDLAFGCKAEYGANRHPSFDVEWGTSVGECVTLDNDYEALPKIETAIAGGTITWNPSEALACLAAPGFPTTCSALFDENYTYATACWAALQGHVADGGACTTGWECQSLNSDCRQGKCAPQ